MTATITTAQAAEQANVTVATIRYWCRYGAITAVKAAGRWAIDTASLTHRITLSARRARKGATMTETTPEPLHRRPGAATYARRNGAWAVKVNGQVWDSLKTTVEAGGRLVVTVTKRDGTTKEQRVTGRAWETASSRARELCQYELELPAEEQHGPSGARGGERCAQCGVRGPVGGLSYELDEDGVGGQVCSRCASRDAWERSYDR